MVDHTSAAGTLVARALIRVPDRPHWVDTRGMLLSGRAVVRARAGSDPSHDPVIVVVPDAALASVVGEPFEEDIRATVHSLSGDVNVLAQVEHASAVARALAGWTERSAIIHTLPRPMPWESEAESQARIFTRQNAPRFDHAPEALRRELLDALDGRTTSRFVHGELPDITTPMTQGVGVPMAAVWADGRPVAFCYPVWQTETWWDVSIETLESHRGKGLGARAARTLIRFMRQTGRAPVWGALDTNAASLALAARLGFREAARIAVFTSA
jgi:RimJ/RimL family protein N-acetyltransferase